MDINVFANFDKISTLPVQDGKTQKVLDKRENSIPTTKSLQGM